MNQETVELFEYIATAYKAAGFPPIHSWTFGPNDGDDVTPYRELRAYGLIQGFTMGEREWRLTQSGLEKILTDE